MFQDTKTLSKVLKFLFVDVNLTKSFIWDLGGIEEDRYSVGFFITIHYTLTDFFKNDM